MPVLHYPGAGATLLMTIELGERQVSIRKTHIADIKVDEER